LLSVGERAPHLRENNGSAASPDRRKNFTRARAFEMRDESGAVRAARGGEAEARRGGPTVLDRVHRGMILFAAGRGAELRRFLIAAGADEKFCLLGNALSALYPSGAEEKRWVDGVMARRKGLGL
ncbi:MAG: DUF1156 domain-containing protein, partial [Pyrinomonadaceae bacterium]